MPTDLYFCLLWYIKGALSCINTRFTWKGSFTGSFWRGLPSSLISFVVIRFKSALINSRTLKCFQVGWLKGYVELDSEIENRLFERTGLRILWLYPMQMIKTPPHKNGVSWAWQSTGSNCEAPIMLGGGCRIRRLHLSNSGRMWVHFHCHHSDPKWWYVRVKSMGQLNLFKIIRIQ